MSKQSIGTTRLCHIAVLVKDMEKALDNWSVILGMEKPNVWNFPPMETVPSFTEGQLGDYSDCKLAVFELDNVRLEIVEPGENSGPWKEALDKYGEGLQHLSFIVPDRHQANASIKSIGGPEAYHIGFWPDSSYAFFNTREQLGVEINIKTDDDNTEKIPHLLKNPEDHKKDLQ